jgi:hypothetical protein
MPIFHAGITLVVSVLAACANAKEEKQKPKINRTNTSRT